MKYVFKLGDSAKFGLAWSFEISGAKSKTDAVRLAKEQLFEQVTTMDPMGRHKGSISFNLDWGIKATIWFDFWDITEDKIIASYPEEPFDMGEPSPAGAVVIAAGVIA